MLKKIKNLDPNTTMLIKAVATVVAVNAVTIIVVNQIKKSSIEA